MKEVLKKIKRIEECLADGQTIACIDAGNGSSGVSLMRDIEDLENYELYDAEYLTRQEFESEYELTVEDCFSFECGDWLDMSDIEGFVKYTDPDNMESNPWRLYVAVYNY